MIEISRDSFIAGILIGLGCIANLSATVPVLGPFLFSLGLITVIVQQRFLYTGKVGYLTFSLFEDYKKLFVGLIFNLIGIVCICYAFKDSIDSSILCTAKYSETFYNALIKSIGCGMLMYIAVEGYKRTKNLLAVILPVMMFIICGFDHCIANYGYMALNGDICFWDLSSWWLLPTWILGNSIGSWIISKI